MSITFYSPFYPVPDDGSFVKGTTKSLVTTTQIGDITTAIENLQNGDSGDFTPPNIPVNLTYTTSIRADGNADVTIMWLGASDAVGFDVEIATNGGNFVSFVSTTTSFLIPPLLPGTPFQVKLRAFDKANNFSGFSLSLSGVAARDNIPPDPPTNLVIDASFKTVYLTWLNAPQTDLANVQVWQSATNNSASAVLIDTVNAYPASPGAWTKGGLATGQTFYYWLKSVDTSGNVSGFNSAPNSGANGTTVTVSGVDLTPGLIGITTVTSLPNPTGYSGPLVVFNQSDGKLYRYVGGNWTAALSTVDLIGTITSTQIADGSITTPKMTANTIDGSVISAGTLNANKIITGTIQAAQIGAGAITASRIAVQSDNLNPDSQLEDPAYWHNYSVLFSDSNYNGATTFQVYYGFQNNPIAAFGETIPAQPLGWYSENGNPGVSAYINSAKWVTLWSGAPGMNNLNARYHLYSGWRWTGDPSTMMRLKPNTVYEIAASCRNATNQRISVSLDLAQTDGTTVGAASGAQSLGWNPGEAIRKSAQFTTGGTTAYARFVIFNDGSGSFAGDTQVGSLTLREANTATMIVDGSIIAGKLAANSIVADNIQAGAITTGKISSNTSLPGSLTIDGNGFNLGAILSSSYDPASRINNGPGTQISSGQINIFGSTTLANWRTGGDETRINGGAISANTIDVTKLTVGNRGVQLLGINFDTDRSNTVYWSSGYVDWFDENYNRQVTFINGGSCTRQNSGSYVVYVWFDRYASPQTQGFYADTTTPASIMANPNNVIVASYFGGTLLNTTYGQTIVDGSNIKTGTVTADRLSVGYLSAVSGNIGLLRTADSGQRMELDSNQLRSYDSNNVMRVRVGIW